MVWEQLFTIHLRPCTWQCLVRVYAYFKIRGTFCHSLSQHLTNFVPTFVLCSQVSHVLPSTRDVVAVILPLLMQHWFVLLKYTHKRVYIVIEVLIEVWWEWTAFLTLEAISKLHWVGGVILLSMLFAHVSLFKHWFRHMVGTIPTEKEN